MVKILTKQSTTGSKLNSKLINYFRNMFGCVTVDKEHRKMDVMKIGNY